jgi:hypothetical protein
MITKIKKTITSINKSPESSSIIAVILFQNRRNLFSKKEIYNGKKSFI